MEWCGKGLEDWFLSTDVPDTKCTLSTFEGPNSINNEYWIWYPRDLEPFADHNYVCKIW